jgi:hypothetical protein
MPKNNPPSSQEKKAYSQAADKEPAPSTPAAREFKPAVNEPSHDDQNTMHLFLQQMTAMNENIAAMAVEVRNVSGRLGKLEEKKSDEKSTSDDDFDESLLMSGSLDILNSSYKPRKVIFNTSDQNGGNGDPDENVLPKPPADPKTGDMKGNRDSIMQRITAEADGITNRITVMQSTPSYDDIRLDALTLGSLMRFIDKVNQYRIAHNLPLPVTTLVADRVREQIIAHNVGLTGPKFYKLTASELFSFLLSEVQPTTPLMYCKAMDRYVKMELPGGYKPTSSNFRPLYDQILVYKNRFMMFHEIMSENNETCVPPLHNKEGGLIKLILDAFPYGYGKRLFHSMKKTSFTSIYEFWKNFTSHLNFHFQVSKVSREMNQVLGDASLETPSKAAARPSFSRPQASRPFNGGSRNNHRVNAIAEDCNEILDDDEYEPPGFSDDDDEDEDPMVRLPSVESVNSDEEYENTVFHQLDAIHPATPTKTPAASPTGIHTGTTRPRGCMNMLQYGSCVHGEKCKYSHDQLAVTAQHKYLSDILNNSKFKPKPAIMRRPDSLGAITSGDSNADVQVEALLNNSVFDDSPEFSLAKAVHREGKIVPTDGEFVVVPDVLFDTGALHGSYISRRLSYKNRHLLKPFRINRKTRVRLADNKTLVEIDEAYMLCVVFKDDAGREHSGSALFWVLDDCSHDMIVGLPAIIRSFSELHKQMIDSVVGSLNSVTDSSAQYPWRMVREEEAPEDAATDLPVNFSYQLHYMEMPYEEAQKEFIALFETHVCKEFAEQTDIIKLLMDKGVNVFIPQNWEGIKGVPDIELDWREGLPDRVKPRPRPINPKLYGNAKNEYDRLSKYFYRDSSSPISSCLVIAPKATAPFIRFCGDYVFINKYIKTGHFPIPNVQKTLEKISKFKVFLDFDLANSFHQFKLAPLTSERLSVQTPWAQVEPVFMPEGIGPASGILQKAMSEIFADFAAWSIAIFDNLLVLATDYNDAYKKTELILDRCRKHNVYLKFSKTWLGFPEANFFGYVCREGGYELSKARKATIMDFPFPTTTKQMQSFLGTALFFKSFVPHYSSQASQLYDMVKKDFDWNESTWTVDYRRFYEEFKLSLMDAMAIHYPDYELEWILRTDASRFGIGAVLLQVFHPTDGGEAVYQPIAFFSEKFSDQATRWSTIEQEAYATYAAVKHFSYYLTAKPFILETDHNNLLFMEQSGVPKIIRWRIYLQSFSFMIRHIAGKLNVAADWLSRFHEREWVPPTPVLAAVEADTATSTRYGTPEAVLAEVHGGRMGHSGSRRTWNLLNKHFPGHRIPYRFVEDFVSTCAICQKERLGMVDNIDPIIRHLKTEGPRSVVGVDTLTVTPPDKDGSTYIIVIVNHFTKFVHLTPIKNKDSLTVAAALFNYFCCYGLFDCIMSDPGSEFTNDVVQQLHKWLGIRHRFSLVGRHESNGVEGSNKQILRHLKALVFDERVLTNWVSLLPLVQLAMNSVENSETGVIPFEATFGSQDFIKSHLSVGEDGPALTHEYLKWLSKSLKMVFEVSKKHQQALIQDRTKETPAEDQNMFQPGDLVLWQQDPNEPLPTKLSPKFVGPYLVSSQEKNDVECRHVILGVVKKFHVTRLKIFHGTLEEAKKVAVLDHDQYVVRRIIAYTGDPNIRTSMHFKVEFEDGSIVWVAWSKDLFDTIPYEEFCRSRPELEPVLGDATAAKKIERELNSKKIVGITPGQTAYVDLRYFSHYHYDDTCPFPDKENTLYLVEGIYYMWENKQHTRISIKFPVFDQVYTVSNVFIKRYGYRTYLPMDGFRLVNSEMAKQLPFGKQKKSKN